MGRDDEYEYKNGIVRYDDGYKSFRCMICYWKNSSPSLSLREHLNSKMHQAILEIYNKHYSDKEGNVTTCNKCHETLFANDVFYHARFHKWAPWYFPDLKEARFFENFMLPGYTYDYNCYLCKESCLFWWQAHEHAKSVKHLELRRKMYPDSQLAKFDFTKSGIEYYRRKHVFLLSDKMAWCWVCDEKILTVNVSEHSKEPRHLAAKRRGVEFSAEKEKEKLPLEVVNESRDNCNEDLYQNDEVDDDDYMTTSSQTNSSVKSIKESVKTTRLSSKPPGQRYACSICDVQLAEKEHIDLHINGLSHKINLEKFKKKFKKGKNLDFYDLPIGVTMNTDDLSFKFECNLCESKISTFSDLVLHVQLSNHLENTGNIYDKCLLMQENKNEVGILSTTLPNIFFCPSCLCTIKGAASISWHIQEKDHLASYKRYVGKIHRGSKQTIPKEDLEKAMTTKEYPVEIKLIDDKFDRYFWCSICCCKLLPPPSDCIFDEDKKIWQHVGGNYHRSTMRLKNKCSSSSTSINSSNKSTTFPITNVDNSLTVLPTESTPEIAADEELYCLPPEQLINVHVKDGKLSAVTCKPCDLYIHGELDDLGADWHRHLETGDHKQKAHIFSISKLSKLTI